jgi:ABC-type multidrug transport system ATPase subunit
MSDILQVKNLCKNYNTFQLRNVSFSVPKGSIMGFVGENGAGKTTTIKLILNEIKRDGGSISVFGFDNIKDERKIKEQIGVVFDDCYFHKEFTATDISKILGKVYATWDKNLYATYLKKFNLAADKKVSEYSKGMKMKLSIACALAHKPKLLILDEATSGLDPIMRSDILDIFLDFIQDEEHSVLFSSHINEFSISFFPIHANKKGPAMLNPSAYIILLQLISGLCKLVVFSLLSLQQLFPFGHKTAYPSGFLCGKAFPSVLFNLFEQSQLLGNLKFK